MITGILMAQIHMMFKIRLTIGFCCIDNKMCFLLPFNVLIVCTFYDNIKIFCVSNGHIGGIMWDIFYVKMNMD